MKFKNIIRVQILLFLLLMPALGRTAEIRQERYNFYMELTRSITGNTFVIGDYPVLPLIGPPVAALVRGNAGAILAVRVASRAASMHASSGPVTGDDALCSVPPVLFALNSAALSGPTGDALLDSLERCTTRETPLVITGHTCNLGPQDVNNLLARQRAEAVAEFLREQGFIVAKVRAKGRSAYKTTDPGKQHLNRRVEITLMNGSSGHTGTP